MTMRLPLSKENFATLISVYTPTMTNADENKEAFYNQMASVLSGIPHIYKGDRVLTQWEEKENSKPHEEWAALQQVVYNTAKTYLGKPDRKHQDCFDPNDQELQTPIRRRDQAHQGV
ncbi:hypothetical protein NP493_2622g00010 [Ridgeia piscesae]|uniref:Uncharacterized protein n=1 Tax=Ridgeia piscesae TaxID=27915 RepID=A0AAD9JFZ4_RIDPI|nr:hypothetical protein NP493_2622g00010 [Ridgeia piscesae]